MFPDAFVRFTHTFSHVIKTVGKTDRLCTPFYPHFQSRDQNCQSCHGTLSGTLLQQRLIKQAPCCNQITLQFNRTLHGVGLNSFTRALIFQVNKNTRCCISNHIGKSYSTFTVTNKECAHQFNTNIYIFGTIMFCYELGNVACAFLQLILSFLEQSMQSCFSSSFYD